MFHYCDLGNKISIKILKISAILHITKIKKKKTLFSKYTKIDKYKETVTGFVQFLDSNSS